MDDQKIIKELGYDALPQEIRDQALQDFYGNVQLRVLNQLQGKLSDEQLAEFNKFVENKDSKGAVDWMLKAFPNYKQLMEEEADKLIKEIKERTDKQMDMADKNRLR